MDHTDYEITLIRSRRKSLAIEITPELQVVVRAPARMPVREINAFVQEKDDWIHAHLHQMAEKKRLREQYRKQALSKEELQELATQAMKLIPQRFIIMHRLLASPTGASLYGIRGQDGEAAAEKAT